MRVTDLESELNAFREIDRRLRVIGSDETLVPLTVVVGAGSLGHFRTYRGVRGIHIDDLTPTRRVAEIIGDTPPPWLTDDIVHNLGLLCQKAPNGKIFNSWEATILEWLIPGITDTKTLYDWFRVAGAVPLNPAFIECEQITAWSASYFADLSAREINSDDLIADLTAALSNASSPAAFAREWSRRVALLPLIDTKADNPLRMSALDPTGPRERALAKLLPLLFPLPASQHDEVSQLMVEAVRRARLNNPSQFEHTVFALNALWDGVADELMYWLDVDPLGMTPRAHEHIQTLPGYSPNDQFARMAALHAPPASVSRWSGCDNAFDNWVYQYASWVSSTFIRRQLPRDDVDPAMLFSKWLKDNYSVIFAHPERSYLTISGRVRKALRKSQVVIIFIVDAMAVQVANAFREAFSQHLEVPPTYCSNVFAPIPTITEVCKGAVVCGQFPDQPSGDLHADLRRAYQLDSDELSVTSNWKDAMRARVSSNTRLLVYRENRLDDALASTGNYKELLSIASDLAQRTANLAKRWVSDLKCATGSIPLVVLTADHGFTYGPTPGSETSGHRSLDGAHRCVAITDQPRSAELQDESLTFVDASRFHTRSNYLAARGRAFGSGTISDWQLSHGGLLPEEVVIPIFEWFGEELPVPWPILDWIGEAKRDRGAWVFRLRIHNAHTMTSPGGDLLITLAGDDAKTSRQFSRLQPGQSALLDVELHTAFLASEGLALTVNTVTKLFGSDDRQPTIERSMQIPKARQLTERTADQQAFEDMF